MRRVIFHIDVNSAFLSWIAIKILAEGGSDIRLVPAVVSGDPSDRRSIVTAASIPAKKLGIKTAMPVSMALPAMSRSRDCPRRLGVVQALLQELYGYLPFVFACASEVFDR